MPVSARSAIVLLLLPALIVGLLTAVGPFKLDPLAAWGGVGVGHSPGWLPGFVSIDPNMGTTSFALGFRAARDLLSGTLPLWNHYEGLGAPLLGEMQSASLFPPTLLLLLPGGQALEQALLQAVAGVGTFLFLRRFGLNRTAALVGGLLFEFNGVFAWLRNAVFNPVAFLPWLFYVVESLFVVHRGAGIAGNRGRLICLGALVAALALYAGFPEVVYFYALLLIGWVGLRAWVLGWPSAARFAGDLAAMAGLAIVISAPLLIAFGHFLREAAVGGHHGVEFRDHVLPPQAFLCVLLPYVFGPLGATPQAAIVAVWRDIGGYLGVAPLLLAAAGFACTWRRGTSRLLAAWVVLAIGAAANCAAPSRLLRLEVMDEGWVARVDGVETRIAPVEDTFQSVALPAGTSVVEFHYEPWALRPSIPLAAAAALFCLAVLAWPRRRFDDNHRADRRRRTTV